MAFERARDAVEIVLFEKAGSIIIETVNSSDSSNHNNDNEHNNRNNRNNN